MKTFFAKHKKLISFVGAIITLAIVQVVGGIELIDTSAFPWAESATTTHTAAAAGLGTLLSIPKNRDTGAPGFKYKVMIFLHRIATGFPTITKEFPSMPADHDNSATGGFTLPAEDTAIVVYADDAPSVESSPQGEDYGSFKNSGKFYLKGDNQLLAKLASTLNNEDCSVVVEKLQDGKQQLYGTENNPARFKPKRSSGGKVTDKNGYELPFEVDCAYPCFELTKTIGENGTATV